MLNNNKNVVYKGDNNDTRKIIRRKGLWYRVGVYAILVGKDGRAAIVKTKKGYFLLGGGLDDNETREECIKRECLEEVGMSVVVKNFICKGGKYSWVDGIGYMYGISYFYFVKSIDRISKPI